MSRSPNVTSIPLDTNNTIDVMCDALTAALARAHGPQDALIGLKLAVQALSDVGLPRMPAESLQSVEEITRIMVERSEDTLGKIAGTHCSAREQNGILAPELLQIVLTQAGHAVERLLASMHGPFEVLVVLAAARHLATTILFEGLDYEETIQAKLRLAGIENHIRGTRVTAMVLTEEQHTHMTRGGQA